MSQVENNSSDEEIAFSTQRLGLDTHSNEAEAQSNHSGSEQGVEKLQESDNRTEEDASEAEVYSPEEALAVLNQKAHHAKEALELYNSAIEKGVEKLLLESDRLTQTSSDSEAERIQKIRSDIQTWSSQLHGAMQAIQNITHTIEDKSAALQFGDVPSSATESSTKE